MTDLLLATDDKLGADQNCRMVNDEVRKPTIRNELDPKALRVAGRVEADTQCVDPHQLGTQAASNDRKPS